MVLHSLRYRSQVVTVWPSCCFSTVTISQVTVYSLLASAVLAIGFELVCVREAWFVLEIAGLAAAYANHFSAEPHPRQVGGPAAPSRSTGPAPLSFPSSGQSSVSATFCAG